MIYYASIMLAYWVDNIKYRSILSNRTVKVSTLVNYRSIFSNRTVTVKLSRGGHGPPWPPLRVAYEFTCEKQPYFCECKWCLQISQIFGPRNNNPLYGTTDVQYIGKQLSYQSSGARILLFRYSKTRLNEWIPKLIVILSTWLYNMVLQYMICI